jgi:hypothetical protein
MPDWSIKIVPAEPPTTDVPAAFVPDLSGAQPGAPLTAQVDDIVTWNNTTNEDHWPVAGRLQWQPLARRSGVDPIRKLLLREDCRRHVVASKL